MTDATGVYIFTCSSLKIMYIDTPSINIPTWDEIFDNERDGGLFASSYCFPEEGAD
jgi:hypothetical protein